MTIITLSLHNHSNASPDSRSDIQRMIRKCEEHGIDAIAITDHDIVFDINRLKGIKTKVKIIPGIEISTEDDAHIIGLFVSSYIKPRRDALTIIRDIHKQKGLAILPHPFRKWQGYLSSKYNRSKTEINSVLNEIDCAEVYSGKCTPKENEAAKLFFKGRKIPLIGGSDAHTINEIGNVLLKIEITNENIREGLLDANRKIVIDSTNKYLEQISYKIRRFGKKTVNFFGIKKSSRIYRTLRELYLNLLVSIKKLLKRK